MPMLTSIVLSDRRKRLGHLTHPPKVILLSWTPQPWMAKASAKPISQSPNDSAEAQ